MNVLVRGILARRKARMAALRRAGRGESACGVYVRDSRWDYVDSTAVTYE